MNIARYCPGCAELLPPDRFYSHTRKCKRCVQADSLDRIDRKRRQQKARDLAAWRQRQTTTPVYR